MASEEMACGATVNVIKRCGTCKTRASVHRRILPSRTGGVNVGLWPIADAVRIVAVVTEPAPVKRILKLLGEPPRWLPIPMHAGHSLGTILRSRHRTGNSSASPRPTSSSTSALPGSGRLLSGAAQPRLCSVCLRSHQNRSPALGKRTSVAAGHGERSEGAESG